MSNRDLIPLGTHIPHYGRVQAIHRGGGERSYFCEEDGVVSRIDEETAYFQIGTLKQPKTLFGRPIVIRTGVEDEGL